MYHSASRQHGLLQPTPRQRNPANPLNQKVDDPTTRPRQPTQDNAENPTTNQCEGDQSMECRIGRGHFGSISQTQQPRLASHSERDEEVPINTTTTRLRQPTQHNAAEPTTSQCERDTPMECRPEGGHIGSISQAQQIRPANQSERDGEVSSASRQHNPANSMNTTLRTHRRTGAKETSMLAVEVKEAFLARCHRHSNKDWTARVNEMMTFQPTPRQHDPVNSTHTTTKTITLEQDDTAKGGSVPLSFTTRPQRTTTHDTRPNPQHAETQQQTSRNDHNHDGPAKHTLADKRRQDPRDNPRAKRA